MSSYAVIKVGGKQYRVGVGERLLVDRLKTEPGKTFTPEVLLADGDLDSHAAVTALVVDHVKGPKIRIGKYKAKSGYKKHTGFRASLTQIQIESIGAARAKATAAQPAAEQPVAEKPAPAAAPERPAPGAPAEAASVAEGDRPQLEAGLAYELEHGKRKGALAALESALAAKENS